MKITGPEEQEVAVAVGWKRGGIMHSESISVTNGVASVIVIAVAWMFV